MKCISTYQKIKPFINETPLFTSSTLDEICKTKVILKMESFQKTGAFKYRGATNSILNLKQGNPQKKIKVCTHSSGNHAGAIARVCRDQGLEAFIVMPKTSPLVKLNAVKGYGAQVFLCEPTQQAREETCKQIQEEYGAVFIAPFDNQDVIEGQGTVFTEISMQMKNRNQSFDAVLTPIGGGGLISGVCLARNELDTKVRIFGSEPRNANDCQRSLQKKERVLNNGPPQTICDGLLTNVGLITWPIIKENVEDIYSVSDEQVKGALKFVWERMKLLIEPSSAVPVAVAMFNDDFREKLKDIDTLVIVISGGNVDLSNSHMYLPKD